MPGFPERWVDLWGGGPVASGEVRGLCWGSLGNFQGSSGECLGDFFSILTTVIAGVCADLPRDGHNTGTEFELHIHILGASQRPLT